MGNGEDRQAGRETAGSEANAAGAGDAWLERRLRVFERALNGLEEKQERCDRAQTTAIGKLEERVAAGEARLEEVEKHFGESHRALEKAIAAASKKLHAPVEEAPAVQYKAAPAPEVVKPEPAAEKVLPAAEIPAAPAAKPDLEFLVAARRSALDAAAKEAEEPKPRRRLSFTKPLVIGLTALVITLTAAAAFLRHTPGTTAAAAAPVGSGISVRHVVKDEAQRIEVLADAGSRRAMHTLAMQFVDKKDMSGAARWFSRAATMGYSDSQFNLAVLYERGEGVRQSLEQAYVWYSLAAIGGDKEAAERVEAIQTQLKPDQLHAADLAVRAFKPDVTNMTADNAPLRISG